MDAAIVAHGAVSISLYASITSVVIDTSPCGKCRSCGRFAAPPERAPDSQNCFQTSVWATGKGGSSAPCCVPGIGELFEYDYLKRRNFFLKIGKIITTDYNNFITIRVTLQLYNTKILNSTLIRKYFFCSR